jgi:hypothetical protein
MIVNLLLELKKAAALRGIIDDGQEMDPGLVFSLVRDMPYQRASDRKPETTIAEWRGTCSGKHYLLQKLLEELGFETKIVACTSITPVDPGDITPQLEPLYTAANCRFVDVHNYLLLSVPGGGEMIVDATWPLSAEQHGMTVNKEFVLGKDQHIATTPIESWVVPAGADPQAFKDRLLHENFSLDELKFREVVIQAISESTQ